MRKIIASLLMLLPAPAVAQNDVGSSEIIVTARRREADNHDDSIPVIGLRRTADFAIQEVTIAGDTRDAEKRKDEIYEMVRGAIQVAVRQGNIELATGEMVVEPLTLANYRNLTLVNDSRPDSQKTTFLIKTALSGSDAKAALDRIEKFVKAVPPVGRAEMRETDDLTLSVVKPDQYRQQIIDLVAADAKATATKMGSDYAVQVTGLDRPVEWGRASLTEVFLYVPYRYTVLPKSH